MTFLDIILSIIITWSVGLLPPAIVRYFIYRRALEKQTALLWTFGLGILELMFFIWSGSQSKTHGVVFLIGLISFKILQNKNGRFDRNLEIHENLPPLQPEPKTEEFIKINPNKIIPSSGLHIHTGWKRLGIVVTFIWIFIIGGRLTLELKGMTSDSYITNVYTPAPEYTDSDFADFEHQLKNALQNPSSISRKNENNADSKDVDLHTEIDQWVENYKNKKSIELIRLLDSFDPPELSPEVIARLSWELSISSISSESESIARRYIQVRDIRSAMNSSPVLRAGIMGLKSPVHSIDYLAIFIWLVLPPFTFLLFWIVIRWVHHGFISNQRIT
ncbi:MAG: hypothetical protein ACOYB2_04895 [Limnohabitans sp.]